MFRLSLIGIIILILIVSGCVTTPVVDYSGENQQLKTRVSSLDEQLIQLKEENSQLRAQVQRVQQQAQVDNKKEIRMPNAAEIQAALKKAGFYQGAIDGQIGTRTKEAIKKFQQANAINPDGVVGSRTWALLLKYQEDNKVQ